MGEFYYHKNLKVWIPLACHDASIISTWQSATKNKERPPEAKKEMIIFIWGGIIDILFQKNNLSKTTLSKANMVILKHCGYIED